MNDIKTITDYKTRVASRYLPLTKDQIGFKLIETDLYFVSEKIDGHFVVLSVTDGKASLYNRTGKELVLDKILKEAQTLFANQTILLACELYVYDKERRTRSFHVSEAISSPDRFDLRLAVYDIIEMNGTPCRLLPEQLRAQLSLLTEKGKIIHAVSQHSIKSKTEIFRLYEELVEKEHAEGLVVRSREGMTYKIKPRHTFDAAIIGYSEGEGDREGLLRNILMAFMKPDGSIHVSAKVGSGFTEEQRRELLIQLKAMHVASEYVEVADSQVAFQMVRPEVVVEFSCLDLIPEMNGKGVKKMDLSYNADSGYIPLRPSYSAVMISPIFQGIRKDKQVNAHDIRFQQVADITELTSDASAEPMAPSVLLKKEVYVKEVKGEKAIRKFMAWKTNKEQSKEFPAYVFYYTDFSAGRKDMLQQEMNIACTEEEVMTAFADSISENIKKGWVKA